MSRLLAHLAVRTFLVSAAAFSLVFAALLAPALAKAHLIVVLPIRSTAALAPRAATLTKAVASALATIDGYDAKAVSGNATAPNGTLAAQRGGEIYVVGQLLASDAGYNLKLGSFDVATDKPIGDWQVALADPSSLPADADIRTLITARAADALPKAPRTGNAADGTVAVAAGLPIVLALNAPLSSSSAKVGETVALHAIDDVISDGHLIVAKGAEGEAEVAVAEAAGGNGHPGKLGLQFNWVASADGSKIKLSNVQRTEDGQGSKGAASTATIATYVLLGPLGLFAHNFVHGKDINLDDKTKLTAYVDKTVHITAPVQSAPNGFAK